jgi:hypothetical protein
MQSQCIFLQEVSTRFRWQRMIRLGPWVLAEDKLTGISKPPPASTSPSDIVWAEFDQGKNQDIAVLKYQREDTG